MIGFPTYFKDGKYNVAFSMPGIDSEFIDGKTAPLIPNIKFIDKFVDGDIGLAESVYEANLPKDIFKYDKQVDLTKSFGSKDPSKMDLSGTDGLKSLEKVAVSTTMESMKPYIEIIKLSLSVLGSAEDIVARVMPLVSVSPLTTRSKIPMKNENAVSYENSTFSEDVSKLNPLITPKTNGTYVLISETYSTVKFIPGYDYKIRYKTIPTFNKNYIPAVSKDSPGYDRCLPDVSFFNLYNSSGELININDKLETIGFNNENVLTSINKADWYFNSPKYNGLFSNYNTPTFKYNGEDILYYGSNDKNKMSGEPAIPNTPIILNMNSNDISTFESYLDDYIGVSSNSSEVRNAVKDNMDVVPYIENIYNFSQLKNASYKESLPIRVKSALKPKKIVNAKASSDEKISKYNKSKGYNEGSIWIDPESDYNLKIIKIVPSKNASYMVNDELVETEIKSFLKNAVEFKEEFDYNIIVKKSNEVIDELYDINSYVIDNWNSSDDIGSIIDNLITYEVDIFDYFNPGLFSDVYLVNDKLVTFSGNVVNVYNYNSSIPMSDNEKIINLKTILSNGSVELNSIRYSLDDLFIDDNLIDGYYLIDGRQIYIEKLKAIRVQRLFYSLSSSNLPENGYKYIFSDNSFSMERLGIGNIRMNNGSVVNYNDLNRNLLDSNPFLSDYSSNDQEIFTIERTMLTELDTEVYYLVEGIRKGSDLVQSNNNSEYYTIKDSIAVFKPVINMCIDIFGELIPTIKSTIQSIQNPQGLITSILSIKMSENMNFMKPPNFNIDTRDGKAMDKFGWLKNNTSKDLSKLKEMKSKIEDENLSNFYVAKDSGSISVIDGSATETFKILDKEVNINLSIKSGVVGNDKLSNDNPMLSMLLGFATLPIKLVAEIIDYIMKTFSKLSNPTKISSVIVEFLSFKWFLDIFKKIPELFGIKKGDGGNKMSDTFSTKYNKDVEFDEMKQKVLKSSPFDKMGGMIDLINGFINGIIKLFWSILGLESIISAPLL